MAASNDSTRLTSTAARVFAGWYFINGAPVSLDDAEVLAANGLPYGDYWVASDFVRELRATAWSTGLRTRTLKRTRSRTSALNGCIRNTG
jgi:hypothetical protein